MASPIAVPPGSRRTAGLIPHFSRRAASRFTCVDFSQPSEPSNVISGMATILRQRGVIVEHPIFALFGLRQRGKFDPMTEAVATDFLPILAAEAPRRSFVVSVHDVAPCTREASARIIEALQRASVRTTSLLVVPNYHRQGSATEDKNFVSWLRDLEARGYEIVIHGYFHERPRRAGERIKEKFITQFYTQDEGEFFDLDYDEAFARITRARDEFETARLSPIGFVAPAWLLNQAGERAARDAGMQYITRIDSVVDLLTNQRELTRSLVYSTGSKWRRTVSLGWNAALARSLEMRELARLSIHPSDFEAPKIWGQILQFIQRFARTRNATTYRDWIGRQRTNRKAT
jgi:predicted deacetylase